MSHGNKEMVRLKKLKIKLNNKFSFQGKYTIGDVINKKPTRIWVESYAYELFLRDSESFEGLYFRDYDLLSITDIRKMSNIEAISFAEKKIQPILDQILLETL